MNNHLAQRNLMEVARDLYALIRFYPNCFLHLRRAGSQLWSFLIMILFTVNLLPGVCCLVNQNHRQIS
jgi:hypothetical protein